MIGIIIIKVLLVIISICTLGILPLVALLNQWIWNEIIIKYVISCGREITSFWIILGVTAIGGGLSSVFGGLIKIFGNK